MPTGDGTPKTANKVKYHWLQNPSDFHPCMNQLLQQDHESQCRAYKVDGASAWELVITDRRPGADANPANQTKSAVLGDVVVWDGEQITVMRKEAYDEKYS